MAAAKVRRAIMTVTLAGGALVGGFLGISHAFADAKAKTPKPSATSGSSGQQGGSSGSTTHHCEHDGASGSGSASGSSLGL